MYRKSLTNYYIIHNAGNQATVQSADFFVDSISDYEFRCGYFSLDDLSAIEYYMKSIQQDKTYREPYLYIAEILNEHKMYRLAVGVVEEGLTQSFRHYNWLERGDTWREKPYDILGISYYYLGNYEKSKENMLKALEYNPTNERLKNNLSFLN